MLLILLDADERKEAKNSTKVSQVKYIVIGIVAAVCFIIIIATISCYAAIKKRQSNTFDDYVQAYSSFLSTNEALLENINTE